MKIPKLKIYVTCFIWEFILISFECFEYLEYRNYESASSWNFVKHIFFNLNLVMKQLNYLIYDDMWSRNFLKLIANYGC